MNKTEKRKMALFFLTLLGVTAIALGSNLLVVIGVAFLIVSAIETRNL